MKRSIVYAGLMTALLALYIWLVGTRVVALIQTGKPAGVAIGIAAAAIPIVTVWFLWKEWNQAQIVNKMYDALAAEGGLIEDTLPRSQAGRVDKDAALEAFPAYARAAEENPGDWRSWFHLGWAYDAAGDRRRARTALRKAATLFRAAPK